MFSLNFKADVSINAGTRKTVPSYEKPAEPVIVFVFVQYATKVAEPVPTTEPVEAAGKLIQSVPVIVEAKTWPAVPGSLFES